MKKPKVGFRQRDLVRLAAEYGLYSSNLGILETARRIAILKKEPIPPTKNLARDYLCSKIGIPTSNERRNKKVARKKIAPHQVVDPNSDSFLSSYEWRSTRMQVLKRDGARCACCGASPKDGVRMHVDHIKPRRKFPNLALDLDNLQVLCEVCNHGKGNWDSTDWREREQELTAEQQAHLRSLQ